MLYIRYNEKGIKALCEKEQLAIFEENGYKYEEDPNVESKSKIQTKEVKVEKIEDVKKVVNTTRANRKQKQDIILE